MKINATKVWTELNRLLFVGLLLVSAGVVLLPQYRIESTITLQRVLLGAACFRTTYRAWKLGHLSRTYAETMNGLVDGSVRSSLSVFEKLSMATGFLAALVLLFS